MTITYTDMQIAHEIVKLTTRGATYEPDVIADMLRSLLTERKSALVQMQLAEVRTGADAQVEAWMSSTSMRIRKAFGAFDDPNKDIETIARELAERQAGSSGDVPGFVLAPCVPTEAMGEAAIRWQHNEYVSDSLGDKYRFYHGIYRAMLWSAVVERALGQPPQPPTKESVREVSDSRFYIDCEFDGHNGPLLSMAIVAQNGCGIHIRTSVRANDPWVIKNVEPLMSAHDAKYSVKVDLNDVGEQIRQFLFDVKEPEIIADSPVDISRFCQAISTGSNGAWMSTNYPRMTFRVENIDCYPTSLKDAVQHNAWWDAMALRHALSNLTENSESEVLGTISEHKLQSAIDVYCKYVGEDDYPSMACAQPSNNLPIGVMKMMPVKFAEENVIFAKDQPEYLPLPAFRSADGNEVTSCWGMSWRERFRVLMTGRVYLTLLTFGKPLTPQIVSVNPPSDAANRGDGDE